MTEVSVRGPVIEPLEKFCDAAQEARPKGGQGRGSSEGGSNSETLLWLKDMVEFSGLGGIWSATGMMRLGGLRGWEGWGSGSCGAGRRECCSTWRGIALKERFRLRDACWLPCSYRWRLVICRGEGLGGG